MEINETFIKRELIFFADVTQKKQAKLRQTSLTLFFFVLIN